MIADSRHQLYFADSLVGKKRPQATAQADDATNSAVSSQRLLFVHNICNFLSLQVPTIRNYRSFRR